MTALHAAVLGLVQGATEFLPVSSSGHLILVPWLLGWPDQGLAFDAAVHLGTVLALLIYFGGEIGHLTSGVMAGRPSERRLGIGVVLAIPAGVAGLALEQVIQTRLRSTTVVAWSTILWALVLWWADRHAAQGGRVHDVRDVGSAGRRDRPGPDARPGPRHVKVRDHHLQRGSSPDSTGRRQPPSRSSWACP